MGRRKGERNAALEYLEWERRDMVVGEGGVRDEGEERVYPAVPVVEVRA